MGVGVGGVGLSASIQGAWAVLHPCPPVRLCRGAALALVLEEAAGPALRPSGPMFVQARGHLLSRPPSPRGSGSHRRTSVLCFVEDAVPGDGSAHWQNGAATLQELSRGITSVSPPRYLAMFGGENVYGKEP